MKEKSLKEGMEEMKRERIVGRKKKERVTDYRDTCQNILPGWESS